jgi:hypothetical protein
LKKVLQPYPEKSRIALYLAINQLKVVFPIDAFTGETVNGSICVKISPNATKNNAALAVSVIQSVRILLKNCVNALTSRLTSAMVAKQSTFAP